MAEILWEEIMSFSLLEAAEKKSFSMRAYQNPTPLSSILFFTKID